MIYDIDIANQYTEISEAGFYVSTFLLYLDYVVLMILSGFTSQFYLILFLSTVQLIIIIDLLN